MQKHVCKMYNKVYYDFTNFVASQCLGHVSNSAHEEQYMCALCDKKLKETSNENPSFTIRLYKVSKYSFRSRLSEST